MILYSDPVKEAKLQEAIARGFIVKHIDRDGIVRYELTPHGQMQWHVERVFGK